MSSPQVSEPVIPISTREWQRQKLGFSVKRDFKWVDLTIYNMNKSFKKLTPSMERLNSEMAKIANALKKAKVQL